MRETRETPSSYNCEGNQGQFPSRGKTKGREVNVMFKSSGRRLAGLRGGGCRRLPEN